MVAVVELESEVAGVVVDADVLFDRVRIEFLDITPSKKALKKGDGFLSVFEVAEWFGFKAEVEVFACFFCKGFDGKCARIKVCENKVFVGSKFLK